MTVNVLDKESHRICSTPQICAASARTHPLSEMPLLHKVIAPGGMMAVQRVFSREELTPSLNQAQPSAPRLHLGEAGLFTTSLKVSII